MTFTRQTHYDSFNEYIQKRINAAVRSVLHKTKVTIQALKDELRSKDLIIEDLKGSIDRERGNSELELREKEQKDHERELREKEQKEHERRKRLENKHREQEKARREQEELREQELREQELREQELREQELHERECREFERLEQEILEKVSQEQNHCEQEASYPPGVLEWRDRCLDACDSEESKSKLESSIRSVLLLLSQCGTIRTINWTSEPILRIPSSIGNSEHPPDLSARSLSNNKKPPNVKKKRRYNKKK
jgi:flagellar biosynthesis GTPase FlhF